MHSINTAPLDGSTILLKHYVRHFQSYGVWPISGTKWEECRWIQSEDKLGYWQPWCGTENMVTTEKIFPDDVIGWFPILELEK